ncbi:MAG: lysophospholipid acyltransferase family protein [Wenzhouxiangellaceae bacterium]|nr:lysophospholipid acyltransferase family protein [Wenzhouxiangellaceae bacterium]
MIRNTLTRAALLPLKFFGRRPLATARRATGWLAGPMRLLMRRRRAIVDRNLALCFPDLKTRRRERIARAHFRQLAEALGEIAFAWNRPGALGDDIGEVVGLEHIEAARAGGRGVVLLTGHCTCLELGARLLGERLRSREIGARAIYRPLRNDVLEAFQNCGRARYAEAMIARNDLHAMVRYLRAGGVLWYAPDQDLGPDRSRFAPFFGIESATATAIVDLARLGRARVVPMYPLKDPAAGRVTVWLEPAFEDFPSGDPVADLTRYNAFLERRIREHPAQYWWLHRRFKTAPPGDPARYPG